MFSLADAIGGGDHSPAHRILTLPLPDDERDDFPVLVVGETPRTFALPQCGSQTLVVSVRPNRSVKLIPRLVIGRIEVEKRIFVGQRNHPLEIFV